MFGSVVLDVAIGMAFVFLLLSLVASTLHEFLASLVQARSANLHRGLAGLFSGGTLHDGSSFVERIYNHGLVQGLYRDERDYPHVKVGSFWSRARRLFTRQIAVAASHKDQQATPMTSPAEPLRSAIAPPPRTLMWRTPLQWLMRVAPVAAIAGIRDLSVLPAYIPSRTFAIALIDLLNENNLAGSQAAAGIRQALHDAHKEAPDNKAYEALTALAANTGDDLTQFQASIEHWYDDAMDRVSGWYKANTQFVLLWIGLILAVALNVNAIQIAKILWFDRDVRQSMVATATAAAAKPSGPSTGSQAAGPADAAALQAEFFRQIGAFQSATDGLLPIGWKQMPSFRLKGDTPKATEERLLRLGTIAAGWLITAFAISLGAAFWFDTLNRFMVVRNTVKPQEKSRSEAGKDAS